MLYFQSVFVKIAKCIFQIDKYICSKQFSQILVSGLGNMTRKEQLDFQVIMLQVYAIADHFKLNFQNVFVKICNCISQIASCIFQIAEYIFKLPNIIYQLLNIFSQLLNIFFKLNGRQKPINHLKVNFVSVQGLCQSPDLLE